MIFNWSKFQAAVSSSLTVKSGIGVGIIPLREAATKCGTTASTISRVTYGKKADLDTVLRICEGLNLNFVDFLEIQKSKKGKKS